MGYVQLQERGYLKQFNQGPMQGPMLAFLVGTLWVIKMIFAHFSPKPAPKAELEKEPRKE